jgi:hypothetical protein
MRRCGLTLLISKRRNRRLDEEQLRRGEKRMNTLTGRVPLVAAMAMATAICGAQQLISVSIDGQPVMFNDTQPRQIGGRVLVPLRGVFEQMGAYVHWTDATQTVDATKGNTSVRLRIGDSIANVNGQNIPLDVPARLIGGSTMVPLRFISEALGANVDWREQAHAVIITTANAMNMPSQQTVVVNNPPPTQTVIVPPPTQVITQTTTQTYTMHASLGVNTVIPVTLNDPLSSDQSRNGDPFTATVVTNGQNNYGGIPAGTRIEGHVVMARPLTGSDPGVLQLAFDRMRLPDGNSQNIDGSLTSLDNNSVTRGENGVMTAKNGKGNKSGDVPVYVGAGAGAGAVIAVLTKGNVLTDALVGGALGLLFHELQKNQSSPRNVTLASGTEMGVRLNQPVNM